MLRRESDREISPPPLKRRKLAPPEPENHDDVRLSDLSKPTAKPRRKIRVFSWNVNGIDPFLPASSAKITSFFKSSDPDRPRDTESREPSSNSLRAFLARHNWPEVLFLQEIKIKNGDTSILASLSASLNTPLNRQDDVLSDERTYTLDATLPQDKHNAKGFNGRLYGVATILRKDYVRKYVECVRKVDWDMEGRVSVVEMKQQPSPASPTIKENGGELTPLALVNVYAVNGTSAPYRLPRTGLVIGTRHNRKIDFHSQLRDECISLEWRGFQVVVAGDVNVARGLLDGHPNLRTFPKQHCINRADFNTKFFGVEDNERAEAYIGREVKDGEWRMKDETEEKTRCLDAVDVFRAIHGSDRRYTWHSRTREWGSCCDRVDLIFVSKGLWTAGRVMDTGILDTPQERGPSDHVPLWVEVAMDQPDSKSQREEPKHLVIQQLTG
ncbi:Endonuclease/exonuclease/phosphatase [Apodospora peruviana]|uniref:Endonuclease/exonuclease/phosphatase n=1 Tax=Apodospora peruviana TaxID=516989 RepID=A0AAE0I3X0_9PEZI|nr:Endonuclease/exonuclease/phosphatase [Apodospora peruviana]